MSVTFRRAAGLIVTLAVPVALAVALAVGPAEADILICERYGSTPIQGGTYIVQNNQWGADVGQCVDVTDDGFTITGGEHAMPTNGGPGAYPSIVRGCHYDNCSTGSGLPAPLADVGALRSSVDIATTPGGSWNAAYDVWLDPTPRTGGQNTGAEIMVWIDRNGPPQPVGSQVGTVTLAGATWDVWYGNIGWNVVSYVRQQGTESFSGDLRGFIDDAVSRGHVDPAWYVTSVQFGFEPWAGGPGLAVESFSVDTGGGGPVPTDPTTTTTAPTSTTSTTSTTPPTTAPGGEGGCTAATQVDRWPGGFVANITVTNRGTAPVAGWTAEFTLHGDAEVAGAWNATTSQSGRRVTAVNAPYNASIAPGGSVSFGFVGTAQTGSGTPAGLTLNGTPCASG
jgi:Glycosyl hydrolase family 12/Cellulose binding domain